MALGFDILSGKYVSVNSVGGAAPPAPVGGNDANTVLLLDFDADPFDAVDSSVGHAIVHTPTISGVTRDTTNKVFGASSANFSTGGRYISYPDSDDWDAGSGKYCFDTRWRTPTFPSAPSNGQYTFFSNMPNTAVSAGWWLWYFFYPVDHATYTKFYLYSSNAAGGFDFQMTSKSIILSSATWYHIVFNWSGLRALISINGDTSAFATIAGTPAAIRNSANALYIGRCNGTSATDMQGNFDETRISKSVNRFTDFIIPTGAYTT